MTETAQKLLRYRHAGNDLPGGRYVFFKPHYDASGRLSGLFYNECWGDGTRTGREGIHFFLDCECPDEMDIWRFASRKVQELETPPPYIPSFN